MVGQTHGVCEGAYIDVCRSHRSGVRPHHAVEKFLAIAADARMARLLKVGRRTPLLLRQHTVFDAGRRPFEFAEVCYVSSRFPLTFDLRRQGR